MKDSLLIIEKDHMQCGDYQEERETVVKKLSEKFVSSTQAGGDDG